jgi:hypothetical protein
MNLAYETGHKKLENYRCDASFFNLVFDWITGRTCLCPDAQPTDHLMTFNTESLFLNEVKFGSEC